MPRQRQWPPSIRHRNGRDYLRVDGREIALGPTGSAEARAEYRRWLTVLEAHGGRLPDRTRPEDLTVAQGVLRYMEHVAERYPAAREQGSFRQAMRPLVRLYGPTPLAEFGPRKLSAIRAELAQHHYRRAANRLLSRIKLALKWLASQELLPRGAIHDLLTVRGLRYGEGRESDPVLPVPEADLAAALPCLGPVLRAAVEVQLLTACRPGELVLMRPCDLLRDDTIRLADGTTFASNGVWVYMPPAHKNT